MTYDEEEDFCPYRKDVLGPCPSLSLDSFFFAQATQAEKMLFSSLCSKRAAHRLAPMFTLPGFKQAKMSVTSIRRLTVILNLE